MRILSAGMPSDANISSRPTVPKLYPTTAVPAVLAITAARKINNLRGLNTPTGFESHLPHTSSEKPHENVGFFYVFSGLRESVVRTEEDKRGQERTLEQEFWQQWRQSRGAPVFSLLRIPKPIRSR
jgi:hypothetical protein